jgi:aspartyl-tRNA synthetase
MDQSVRLSGWIHNKRDHGGVLFIDLRDHYGITQAVSFPDSPIHDELGRLSKETVIRVEGKVIPREEDNINPKLKTGEVEVSVDSYEILSVCEQHPLPVFPEEKVPEEVRLQYRFVDLRRGRMHGNIVFRSKVISRVR